MRYTTTERKLLSIVETLKEFRNILLGQKFIVYTDHKNLTCTNFNTERVIRWRLILKEYRLELHYIKGGSNVVVDALSRLYMLAMHPPTEEEVAYLYAVIANRMWAKAFLLSYVQIEDHQKCTIIHCADS